MVTRSAAGSRRSVYWPASWTCTSRGLTTPIPLFCETSFGWQRKIGSRRDIARKVAGQAWETDRFSPEAKDPANEFLFPHLGTMFALERSSFADCAQRLWGPILPLLVEKSV